MIEGQWFEVSYAQFARFLGFRRTDADHLRIHMALKLEARKKSLCIQGTKVETLVRL
jgi:hypothetical protein